MISTIRTEIWIRSRSDQKYNYVDGRTASYMIYPDRARERLIKRKLTRQRLIQLGLGGILNPEKPAQTSNTRPEKEKYRPLPKDAQLLLVSPVQEERSTYAERNKIEAKLESILKSERRNCAKLDGRSNRLYDGNWLAACSPGQIGRVEEKLAKIAGLTIQKIAVREDLFLPLDSNSVEEAMSTLNAYNKPFGRRMTALSYLHSAEGLDREAFRKMARSIQVLLTQLNAITEALGDPALMDVKEKMAREQNLKFDWDAVKKLDSPARRALKSSELYERLIGPLRGELVSNLDRLREMGLAETARVVLLGAEWADGQVLPLLDEVMVDTWLAWLSEYIGEVRQVPHLISPKAWEEQKWQQRSHSGGIFSEAKLSGSLADVYQWSLERGDSLFLEIEDLKPFPLVALGMVKDNRMLKKKIVGFVIQADAMFKNEIPKIQDNAKFFDFVNYLKSPEEAMPVLRRFWLSGTLTVEEARELRRVQPFFADIADADLVASLTGVRHEASGRSSIRRDKIDGSDALMKFIQMLGWPQGVFLRTDDFNIDVYYTNVMEILIELLEHSEDTVKSQGTYIALLDTAVGLQRRLNANLNELPRRSPTLRRRQVELDRVIQRKLLHAISSIQSGGDPATCEALLSPDPWSLGRRLRD